MKIASTVVIFLIALAPVANAASNSCDKPRRIDSGYPIVDNAEENGDQRIDHGTVVKYKCRNGKVLIERGNVVCHFGVWVGELPKCVGKCNTNDLHQLYDGLDITKNMEYNHFETLDIHCLEGYFASIPEMSIMCQNGEWKVPDNPCNKNCNTNDLQHYDGLDITKNMVYNHSEILDINCIEGYAAFSSDSEISIICQNGEWKVPDNPCNEVWCYTDALTAYEGLRVPEEDFLFNFESFQIECMKGYDVLIPGENITCVNGTWSIEQEPCKERVTCELPLPPEHGSVKLSDDLKVGALAKYSCNADKMLYGAPTAKCLISGEWTYPPPKCLSFCYIPDVKNGEIGKFRIRSRPRQRKKFKEFNKFSRGKRVSHYETLFLRCNEGFLPTENETIYESNLLDVKCNDGTWTTNFQCIEAPCKLNKIDYSGIIMPSWEFLLSGDDFEIVCENGFTASTPRRHITCFRGELDITESPCMEAPCFMIDINFPGLILPSWDFLLSGDHFDIVCENGFWESAPKKDISCFRGEWNITEEPCIEAPCYTDEINYPGLIISSSEFLSSGDDFDIVCESGFMKLIFEQKITCLRGKWDAIENPCIEAICNMSEINFPGLVKPSMDMLLSGEDFDIVCENGFRKSTSTRKITCLRGEWDITENPCTEAPCNMNKIQFPGLIIPSRDFLKSGDDFDISCENGVRELNSKRKITCFRGEWDVTENPCAEVSECIIPNVAHGFVGKKIGAYARSSFRVVSNGSSFPSGTVLWLFCKRPYSVNGEGKQREEVMCSRGRWSKNLVCLRGSFVCLPPTKPPGSKLKFDPEKDVYKFGESLTFSCPPGMVLSSESQLIMCLKNGWSENLLPECEEGSYDYY